MERNSEAIDAYCECVVMRDVAFCPDTSQIRCCFRYMLRSLLLSMFQPRYAVAQVRQEFTCYMKLLLERIIEVLIAQPTPNVSPFVAQLRLMTPEAHKQEIEQTATIFMQVGDVVLTSERLDFVAAQSTNRHRVHAGFAQSACHQHCREQAANAAQRAESYSTRNAALYRRPALAN